MKLVCIGDSLTSGYKETVYRAWPEVLKTKYTYEILNKGIPGDTTSGMLSRFYRDVLDNHPSHVIITGGINDLIWEVPLPIIESNIAAMVQHSYHSRIMPMIGIPVPVDAENAARYWPFTDNFLKVNDELIKYRDWIYHFSRNFGCGVIDFYNAFIDDITGNALGEYYFDGVHPTAYGNEIMAELAYLF